MLYKLNYVLKQDLADLPPRQCYKTTHNSYNPPYMR